MMGSGKSTVGRLLAAETGWSYVDNDELVARHTGTTARELLARGGEPALREAESAALALGAALPAPVIVGAAAGTILDPANRELMRNAIVVWLDASSDVLAERASGAAHRPFVDGDAATWLTAAAEEREPLYRSVADVIVDTGSASPADAVRTIRAKLAEEPGCAEPTG